MYHLELTPESYNFSVNPIGGKELPDSPLLRTLDSKTELLNILKKTKIKRNWFLYPKGFTLGRDLSSCGCLKKDRL